MPSSLRYLCLAFAVAALQSVVAQEPTRQSVEIAAVGRQTANEVSYIYGPPSGPIRVDHEQLFGGGLVAYSFALTPTLALEASGGYLFGRQIQTPQNGGEQILGHLGLRTAVPLGHSRYAFRARLAPGISSFSSAVRSNVLNSTIDPSSGIGYITATPNDGRITHFSLEEGVGISTRLSARTFFNVDVSHETLLQGDRYQLAPLFNTPVGEKAFIEDHVLVTVGLSRSFGRAFQPAPRLHSETGTEAPDTELVLSYTLQPTVHLNEGSLGLDAGFAITGSHFLRPWLALDSSVILLRGGDTPNYQDGGSQLQFFAGIKAGLRQPRYGLFVKARPGLIRFSQTYNPSLGYPTPPSIANDFGGDFGAVLELYPTRHLVLRFDLGETLIRYSAVADTVPAFSAGQPAYNLNQPAFYADAAQFLVGTGWRF